jgi:fused signal recognition particle receptor
LKWLEKLKVGLGKTRSVLLNQTQVLIEKSRGIDAEFWEALEELLVQADLGVSVVSELIEELRRQKPKKDEVLPALKLKLKEILTQPQVELVSPQLDVYLMVGVNGTGKTTAVAKLAKWLRSKGKQVILVAADTFRAAAIDQLAQLGEEVGCQVVKQERGADAAAVVFDALKASLSRGVEGVVVDTAGRLHTRGDLMEELKKIKRVAEKAAPSTRIINLLVIDATFGQNALAQAKVFQDSLKIDGIVLTKIDGTAKGGSVAAISRQLNLPIWFLSFGESLDDFKEFVADEFVEALLS